jgi:protein-tyrosine phosphatase
MARHVDLHAHFLPGLDDGADSLATCLSMVRVLNDMGFSDLCATPHQFAGMYQPPLDKVRAVFDQVEREVAGVLPELHLRLGAENYWDEVSVGRLRRGEPPCYNGDKAFLFEISPMLIPPGLEAALFEARVAGRLPVLAHPERYLSVQKDPAVAEALGRQAALLVDLVALSGRGARAEVKTARRLVEEGIAHAVASDMHDPDDEPAIVQGLAWLQKRMGTETVTQLLGENPRRILVGQLP